LLVKREYRWYLPTQHLWTVRVQKINGLRTFSMSPKLNNLKIAIRVLETNQKATKSPSLWQSYEEELILLRERLEKIEHGTT
jgi:hypothetical protein